MKTSLVLFLISSCYAAVHPTTENDDQILRSNSYDELSSRSTAQMPTYYDKTEFFSTKRPYSKRSDLSEYQRDLVLGRHPSYFTAEDDEYGTRKQQQLQQLKNQKLKPRRKQGRKEDNENNDNCSGVCSIS